MPPVIADAIFRSAGNTSPLLPQLVTTDKILGGGFSSELIQIDGLLIGYDVASADAILQISSGDAVFPVILPKSLAGAKVVAWKTGSRLRLLAFVRSIRWMLKAILAAEWPRRHPSVCSCALQLTSPC